MPPDPPSKADAQEGWHTHGDGIWHRHETSEHLHDHGHGHDHAHDSRSPEAPEAVGGPRSIEVGRPVLARNDRLAERNRGFLRARGVTALNLVSAPGAGKTLLVERTVERLAPTCPVAVVVGDLATVRDAERIRAAGAPVVQITTGTVCHLDAEMVARGMEQLNLTDRRVLLIENVGNLVCPADFDLGEDLRVVLVSVTEGEDKPLKYPPIFKSAQAIVVTKVDLIEASGCDIEALRHNLRGVAPNAELLEVSARTGQGMEAWVAWVRRQVGA